MGRLLLWNPFGYKVHFFFLIRVFLRNVNNDHDNNFLIKINVHSLNPHKFQAVCKGTLHLYLYLSLIVFVKGRYCYPHFMGEELRCYNLPNIT